MKETLLQRCQREAREFYEDELCCLDDSCGKQRQVVEKYSTLIANTLKQAAEALEVMVKTNKDPYMFPLTEKRFLTEAQKLIRGELDI